MTNPLTLDYFEYQIIGHGEQPIAEEHIEIQCKAKEIGKKIIQVKNPYQEKSVNYRIQTDLLNCKIPNKLSMKAGGKADFEITVQPMLCGQYTGSISFFEDDGPQYMWYTVSVITDYPQAYKTIKIESEVRRK